MPCRSSATTSPSTARAPNSSTTDRGRCTLRRGPLPHRPRRGSRAPRWPTPPRPGSCSSAIAAPSCATATRCSSGLADRLDAASAACLGRAQSRDGGDDQQQDQARRPGIGRDDVRPRPAAAAKTIPTRARSIPTRCEPPSGQIELEPHDAPQQKGHHRRQQEPVPGAISRPNRVSATPAVASVA